MAVEAVSITGDRPRKDYLTSCLEQSVIVLIFILHHLDETTSYVIYQFFK
jgi:hypothetical protein